MLSPEEKSLLENAKALINEIESMQEGEAAEEEEIEMQMNDEEENNEEEEERVEESSDGNVQKQESEGSTASDDAEERVEDLPEQTEENVDDVAKAIVSLLTGAPVKKTVTSASGTSREMLTVLTTLTRVVKSLAESQKEHDLALSNILEGLGIADQLKTVQKSQSQKPVINNDQNEVVNELVAVIKGLQSDQEKPTEEVNHQAVRKSLGEILPMIFDKNRYQG